LSNLFCRVNHKDTKDKNCIRQFNIDKAVVFFFESFTSNPLIPIPLILYSSNPILMISAIIVAGGKGIRMNNKTRKQYMLLGGRPVLEHTLMLFDTCNEIDKIYLVVPEEDVEVCRENLLSSINLHKKIHLVPGGSERQESVYNGLTAIEDKYGIVLIHDGVRPFISHEQISACIAGASECGACIPGIPAFDTLKSVNSSGYIDKTLKRDTVWLAQTPQAFQYDLILNAHEKARKESYIGTDDASLVEKMGEKVKIITGSRFNIKITTPDDLVLAEAIYGCISD